MASRTWAGLRTSNPILASTLKGYAHGMRVEVSRGRGGVHCSLVPRILVREGSGKQPATRRQTRDGRHLVCKADTFWSVPALVDVETPAGGRCTFTPSNAGKSVFVPCASVLVHENVSAAELAFPPGHPGSRGQVHRANHASFHGSLLRGRDVHRKSLATCTSGLMAGVGRDLRVVRGGEGWRRGREARVVAAWT